MVKDSNETEKGATTLKITVRDGSIPDMLHIVEEYNKGCRDKRTLKQILDGPDYQMEFCRYGSRVPREAFEDYFMACPDLHTDQIDNVALKSHHEYWRQVFADPGRYQLAWERWSRFLTPDKLQEGVDRALAGLPAYVELENIDVVFTLGIGPSFGYPYKNCIHFDLIQLEAMYGREGGQQEFMAVVAHEVHHIGFAQVAAQVDERKLAESEEGYLCLSLAGEGLAVKFTNNCGGMLTRQLCPGQPVFCLDPDTISYLMGDFENTFEHFKETVSRIRRGELRGREAVDRELTEYWYNPYMEGQKKGEIPKLKQSRAYTFGCELWGVIYDAFGLEILYDTVLHPWLCLERFHAALDKLDKRKYRI